MKHIFATINQLQCNHSVNNEGGSIWARRRMKKTDFNFVFARVQQQRDTEALQCAQMYTGPLD